jgi:hypothetical protein
MFPIVFAALVGSSRVVLDLAGDGRLETVTLTEQKHAAVVSITYRDRHAPQRFTFVTDSSREDAICALPAVLRVESQDWDPTQAVGHVDGFVRSKSAQGFALVDGTCDSIHFYWNHRTHRVDWWRE